MTTKDLNVSLETSSTTLLKPTTSICQSVSSEYLKSIELTEFCKQAENYLKEAEMKITQQKNTIMESEKLKVEYMSRNKINLINFESLNQAKNELFKYKSQLKSNYIEMEKVFKFRRQKYQKVVSSYESEWQRTLDQYNSDPTVVEFLQIQEENDFLEKEIEKVENLKINTEKNFFKLKENIEENFFKKIVEFSKALVEYKKHFEHQNGTEQENDSSDQQEKTTVSSGFNFLRNKLPMLKSTADDNEDAMSVSPLDVSFFDDVSIPTENLETPNEDELFLLIENNMEELEKNTDDRQENMEVDPKCSGSENQSKNSQDYLDAGKEMVQESEEMNEIESQYFRFQMEQQQMEISECRINPQENFKVGNKEEFEDDTQMGKLKANEVTVGGNRELPREMQIAKEPLGLENEESLSNGSFDNQYGYQSKPSENKQLMACEYNENYDYQFNQIPSASSDEASHTANESYDSPDKVETEKQTTNNLPKKDQEKEEFKSFAGFFTMGIEDEQQKQSIFKLF